MGRRHRPSAARRSSTRLAARPAARPPRPTPPAAPPRVRQFAPLSSSRHLAQRAALLCSLLAVLAACTLHVLLALYSRASIFQEKAKAETDRWCACSPVQPDEGRCGQCGARQRAIQPHAAGGHARSRVHTHGVHARCALNSTWQCPVDSHLFAHHPSADSSLWCALASGCQACHCTTYCKKLVPDIATGGSALTTGGEYGWAPATDGGGAAAPSAPSGAGWVWEGTRALARLLSGDWTHCCHMACCMSCAASLPKPAPPSWAVHARRAAASQSKCICNTRCTLPRCLLSDAVQRRRSYGETCTWRCPTGGRASCGTSVTTAPLESFWVRQVHYLFASLWCSIFECFQKSRLRYIDHDGIATVALGAPPASPQMVLGMAGRSCRAAAQICM